MTITTVYSPKGGSGTTTIAAAIAVLLSRNAQAVIVDAAEQDDMPAALGLGAQVGPGFMEWAKDGASDLGSFGVAVTLDLALIPHGTGTLDRRDAVTTGHIGDRLRASAGDLHIVVDCGSNTDLAAWCSWSSAPATWRCVELSRRLLSRPAWSSSRNRTARSTRPTSRTCSACPSGPSSRGIPPSRGVSTPACWASASPAP